MVRYKFEWNWIINIMWLSVSNEIYSSKNNATLSESMWQTDIGKMWLDEKKMTLF